jgi:hypothetical protein
MATIDNIRWFKQTFGKQMLAAVKGTPFSVDMLTAIACQETGYVWGRLRTKDLAIERILELSVGDTISARASTFPKSKADLLAAPKGAAMFKIAHDSLVDLARYLPDFAGAARNPDKFCHGFGIFQYDIQFFKTDPAYFLERRWATFGATLAKALSELKSKMAKAGVAGRTSLTDMEMAQVAIAYNRGRYDPALGLKQGHKDQQGVYYGEHFANFLKLAKSVPMPAGPAPSRPPAKPDALLYAVTTRGSDLMLRSSPLSADKTNIIGPMKNGLQVHLISAVPIDGSLQIEADVGGKPHKGYAGAAFLKPVDTPAR